jgi:hypothetical protein
MEYSFNIVFKGDLELLMELFSEGRTFQRSDVIGLFKEAVRYGHLKICKWLYLSFKITKNELIYDKNEVTTRDDVFIKVCRGGNLEVCEWLQETFQFTKNEIFNVRNIHAASFYYNNYHIILFLCNTFGITESEMKEITRNSSEEEKEKILQCLIGSFTKRAES